VEVEASDGDQPIGRLLLKVLAKARTAAVQGQEAADAGKRRRVASRLRKVERRLISFAYRVRSLSGSRLIENADPEGLIAASDAIREDALALRETFK
jgi:hypothetical protein